MSLDAYRCVLCRRWDRFCECCTCTYMVSTEGFYVRVDVPGCPVHDRGPVYVLLEPAEPSQD